MIGPRVGVPAPSRAEPEAPHLLYLVQQRAVSSSRLWPSLKTFSSPQRRGYKALSRAQRVRSVLIHPFTVQMSNSGIFTLQKKAFLARKSIARSVIKLQQKLLETSARFTGIVVQLGEATARCQADFTDPVRAFSLLWLIIKKLNSDNYSKCIIYKSPTSVHRIYTYKHYSTFVEETKIRQGHDLV